MVDRRPMNREKTSAESRSTSRFSSRHETNTLTHSKNYRRTAGLRWLPIYGITSAYQIILWMANIHRYLQSAMQKWALFFSTIRPSVLNSCSTFISTFFSGWNGLWELVHIHGDTGKKRSRNYLNGHWHDDSEPNYPLIAIDVQSIPMFKCVNSCVHNALTHTLPDKYATLDRISLMHSNNHKAVQLSNRNLLNGPFHQRSMLWTFVERLMEILLDVVWCFFFKKSSFVAGISKLRIKVFEFNKLLKTITYRFPLFLG